MKNEELVQRFIDQELSAEERIQFVVALGRDQALRERALALEQLVLDATKLPRPLVPEGFAARVLECTTAPVVSGVLTTVASAEVVSRTRTWRRLIDAMWAPRVLQWNLAGAAAVACVALIAVGALVATGLRRPVASVADATPAVSAPAQSPVVLVRLVVVQPDARVVQAAGDFNGWNPSRTPLEQTADGAWTVTLPLEPGRYEYQFVVDGDRWIGDPFAVEQSNDGFGSRNAVLDVRPAEASL
jgi:AMP-activated protein kinase-like protein